MNTKHSYGKWVNTAITLAFMFLFRFLPPFGTLSALSMQVIGVFVGTLYGWIFVDMGWPSLIGMVALGLTDYCTMNELFVSSFGSQTLMMLTGMLLLSAYVQQQGITDVIVDGLLTLKVARGRPYVTLFCFLFAAFAATLLSQCLAMTVLFIAIFRAIVKKAGIAPFSKTVSVFLVGLSFSTIIGDIALPFKNSAIIGLTTFQTLSGMTYNGALYAAIAFPLCVVLILVYIGMCKYILRIRMPELEQKDFQLDLATVTPRKKLGLVLTLLALCTLLLPSTLPAGWPLTQVLNRMGLGGLAFLMVALLGIIEYQGEALLDLGKIAGFFQWKVLLVQAQLLTLAAAISSEEVGVQNIISDVFTELASGLPIAALVVATVFMVCLVTNLANNIIIQTLFITIGCYTCSSLGCPELIFPLTILITFAANVALMLPSACPVNCVIFGQRDIVKGSYQMLLGVLTSVLFCIVLSVVGLGLMVLLV